MVVSKSEMAHNPSSHRLAYYIDDLHNVKTRFVRRKILTPPMAVNKPAKNWLEVAIVPVEESE